MSKILKCDDLNPGCDFVARGNNEEEVLRMAADHARVQHGLTNLPPEVVQTVRGLIRDEEQASRKIAQ